MNVWMTVSDRMNGNGLERTNGVEAEAEEICGSRGKGKRISVSFLEITNLLMHAKRMRKNSR
jgi:hypothetical protein